jgi:hypothetical protein
MRRNKRALWLLGSLLAAALITSGVTLARKPAPATIPDGTAIHVRLDNAVDSNQSRSGDEFKATISEPVVVDGKTVIPKGAAAKGLVVDARESGHLKGVPRLRLALSSVELDGKTYDLRTSPGLRNGKNHRRRNWEWIGGGAGAGLLVGAIAGGGKGALIGGPIGAGVGTAVAYFTGKRDIRLSAETPLTFRLSQPLTIPLKS